MADKKISALTSLAQGDVAVSTDVLPIVDTSATETKKVTAAALVGAGLSAGVTSVDINSGSIDGTTIGASSASTGAFTTLSASSTVSGTGFSTYLASPPAIGGTAAAAGSFTTLTTSSTVTLNGGTANGVLYLNGSKVATSGSALTFDGTNVGLGNSSGAGKFEVYQNNNSGVPAIYARQDGTAPIQSWHVAAGATKMVLTSSGDLGIGTSSPGSKLDTAGTIRSTSQTVPASGTGAELFYDATNAGLRGYNRTGAAYVNLALNDNMYVGGGSSGNVGIGTTSPGSKLDLVGVMQWQATAGTVLGKLTYAGGEPVVLANTGLGLNFYTNNAFAAKIDSSGNLGLGVTPSAWASFKGLQVGEVGAFASADFGGSNVQTFLGNNVYYGSNFSYIKTNVASIYRIVGKEHQWSYAESGTAGDTIAFTRQMTLDASGRLIVGSTSSTATITANASGGGSVRAIRESSSATNYIQMDHDGTNGTLRVTGANALIFDTNSGERARISSGGYAKFSNSGSYYSSTGSYHELRSNAAAEYIAQIITSQSTGANCYGIRILYENAAPNGTTNPFWQCQDSTNVRGLLRSNGGLENYSANNVNIASDERLKKDIAPLSSVWGKVKDIEVVNYRYKDCNEGDPLLYGVIAQQVQPIVPDLVVVTREATETEPEYYGIREQPMYWLAIKALQEAMTRIEQLEAKVAAWESK